MAPWAHTGESRTGTCTVSWAQNHEACSDTILLDTQALGPEDGAWGGQGFSAAAPYAPTWPLLRLKPGWTPSPWCRS